MTKPNDFQTLVEVVNDENNQGNSLETAALFEWLEKMIEADNERS